VDAPTGANIFATDSDRQNPSAVSSTPTWGEALGTTGTIKLLVLVVLVSWLYWDQFLRLFNYWQTPDWSHGFLIPFFCLYLVNMRRRDLLTGPHDGSIVGLLLVVLCIAAYFASITMKIGYPQTLSILGVISGLVLLIRGWRSLWLTVFPIAFLFLAIPPPDRLYRQFTHPLQQMAAAIATWILNLFPDVISITRSGIAISYFMKGGEAGQFTVAGACSGMRSLMAFVALGLAVAYITERPTWQRVAMAIFVVPVALTCNILRVIITGALQMYGYSDLAKGTPHTLLGLIMFAFGFVLYMGLLWILDHLIQEDDASQQAAEG
jgi:exosortase